MAEINSSSAAEKARQFPSGPGVYLMKDVQGTVIYIGKAKNLRNRASTYFSKAASTDERICELIKHIIDVECVPTETEVDAVLTEARLIKDLRPRFNRELKDDKTFPYLQIRTREEYPRVEFTRKPRRRGVRLYGPFTSARSLRMAIQVLQRVFQFRTCALDIRSGEQRWRWFRPCILHNIRQCTAPCNLRISREEYRAQIRSLCLVLDGKKEKLIREMERDMQSAAEALQFEKAAKLRDDIAALRSLKMRGDVDRDMQPEAFHINPRKGLLGLRRVLGLRDVPRVIEGIDIAHLAGADTVASLVTFIDGTPFKPGYRRFKIRLVPGVDDFASIREVVSRRMRRVCNDDGVVPDILLIDGGIGQLNAAKEACDLAGVEPPCLISLAKREEVIFRLGSNDPIRLSRHAASLRLLQSVRDEAHRFARHYHHLLRRKRLEKNRPIDKSPGNRSNGRADIADER